MPRDRVNSANPTLLVALLLLVLVSAGCVHSGIPPVTMSPYDLRNMAAMLQTEAQDQSRLLEALTSTPEYRRFAEEVSCATRAAARVVCMLREYEGGVFGAVCLFESNSITRATWLPIHERDRNVAIQSVAVDSKRAAVVWDLLERPMWTMLPLYRSLRVSDETSPAPYFLALRTRGPASFHCAVFTHHEASYSQLSDALTECVGSTNYMGGYRMLAIPSGTNSSNTGPQSSR